MIIRGETLRTAVDIAELGLFPPDRVEVETLERMRLGRFTVSGAAVAIASSFLPGVTWLAADRTVAEGIRKERPDSVVYTGTELARILEANPGRDTLGVVHEAKQVFGGRLVKIVPAREKQEWGNGQFSEVLE